MLAKTPAKTQRMLSLPEPTLRVLNAGDKGDSHTKSAVEVSKQLQKLMLKMKGDVILDDGSGVHYEQLKRSKLFQHYLDLVQTLNYIDLTTLGEKEKVAFFINIYNALTIHGLTECRELPTSVLNIRSFWKVTAYNIGSHVFTLEDIEHGILRGNRPDPAATEPPFSSDDPRLKFIVKQMDPRIHFALVCGAKSCPAVNVYTTENIDNALDAASRSFCEQEVSVYEIQKEIHVSKIFQWYMLDFGQNDVDAVRWMMPYLSPAKQKPLQSLLDTLVNVGMVDILYKDYNWNLNNV